METVVDDRQAARANGVLRCECYRYPVLSGIPILRQQSPEGTHVDPIVKWIEKGDLEAATRAALRLPPASSSSAGGIRRLISSALWPGRANGRQASPQVLAPGDDFRSALYAWKARAFADYLYYRHSNPSFMAATILICLLRELNRTEVSVPAASSRTRILDLSCGLGHASFLMGALFPDLEIVAVDWDFANLRLAQQFVAPDATFICVDGEIPLPFADGEFSACLDLDGLHYIHSKAALLKELDRVLRRDAIWLFPHLHNALQKNVAPGVPLAPAGWRRLFAFIPNRLLPESDLIAGFSRFDECDLACETGSEQLDVSPTLAAVATRREGFWHVRQGLSQIIAEGADKLGVNPLLQLDWSAARLQMTAGWPSEGLREECTLAGIALPESLILDRADVTRAGLDDAGPVDRAFERELIRRFVLVPLSPGYPRTGPPRLA